MTTKDISIGKDRWIKWIDFSPTEEVFEIDSLLDATWDFWKLLETECVVECCGIYAFSFWEENIQRALTDFDKLEIIKQLKSLREKIQESNCNVIISSKFNNLFDKTVFIQLLEHVVYCIVEN